MWFRQPNSSNSPGNTSTRYLPGHNATADSRRVASSKNDANFLHIILLIFFFKIIFLETFDQEYIPPEKEIKLYSQCQYMLLAE